MNYINGWTLMKNVRTQMQQKVLDLFPEKEELSAAQILSLLRKRNEEEIATDLPYQVSYLLSYLEMRGDLVFYPFSATYRRA